MHRAWLWQVATAFCVRDFRTTASVASALSMMASTNNATTLLSTSPGVDFIRYHDTGLLMCHLKSPINSTQDEARAMLSTLEELPRTFAVLADIQLKGRGTQVSRAGFTLTSRINLLVRQIRL
jgi:hypothetical protein